MKSIRKSYQRIAIAMMMLTACHQTASQQDELALWDLKREKNVQGTDMQLSYMPACDKKAAAGQGGVTGADELGFRLRVMPPKDQDHAPVTMHANVDTLFNVVVGKDTIAPLFAQQIANGNIGGTEYLVVFDRTQLKQDTACTFLFRDWLFTNTHLSFRFNLTNTKKLDAKSCSI